MAPPDETNHHKASVVLRQNIGKRKAALARLVTEAPSFDEQTNADFSTLQPKEKAVEVNLLTCEIMTAYKNVNDMIKSVKAADAECKACIAAIEDAEARGN